MKKFLLFLIIGLLLTFVGLAFVLAKTYRHPAPAAKNVLAPQTKETIIEGWTLQDIADDLNADPKREDAPHLATQAEFLAAAKNFPTTDYPLLNSKPAGSSLEGFVFPDTYFLPLSVSSTTNESEVLLTKALNNFSEKFTPAMQQAADARGMSIFQIVTLASIVEKETGRNTVTDQEKQSLADERKTIAGIFYNRLAIGMPLESDATVNYITKKNMPSASAEDITIDNPYNTYLYKGLPPGPICNPSLSSLMAVLYPTKTNYFYFLHAQPSGQVYYAQTYAEHLQNKQKYLQ